MKILHINVRLTEGGAAKVALDIHKNAPVESLFAYGYSQGGNENPAGPALRALRTTKHTVAKLNFIAYKFANRDVFNPTSDLKMRLEAAIRDADIVHLHVIHSYFLQYEWLIELLIESEKRVVWTCHDHWIVTGRCALTDGCLRWKDSNSCWKCPSITNYPPVLIDVAAKRVRPKRALITKLAASSKCRLVVPSEHLARDIKQIYPQARVAIVNNSVEATLSACDFSQNLTHTTIETRALVVAHDLSYNGKTNKALVERLLELPFIALDTVGKHSIFQQSNVRNHGYISSKQELALVYSNADFLFFTSSVDNYPLVLIEALQNGLPVIASCSPAAEEILSRVGGRPFKDEDELRSIIGRRNWLETLYGGQSRIAIRNRAMKYFALDRMVSEYMDIYASLLAS